MTRTELIIQLLKVAIGLAFGAYFVWWSLQVLDRLTPEYNARTAVVARASEAPPPRQSGVRGVDPRLRQADDRTPTHGYEATREAANASP